MTAARNHAVVGVVDDKIYVIGGRFGSAFIFTGSNANVVEGYDPTTDQWGLVKARMPTEQSRRAAIEAASLRFHPILMTSLAFIFGVASRYSIGTSVFGGMIAVTILSVLFVSLLFIVI